MAPIKGMLVDLSTHNDSDSGTDDEVYIGFWGTRGGREFPLSVDGFEDFATGSEVRYILGGDPTTTPTLAQRPDNSKPGQDNDPGRLAIELDSIQYVYLRKQAYGKDKDDDAYKVRSVSVFLYGDPNAGGGRVFVLDTAGNGLWLGNEFGHKVWLTDVRIKG